MVPGPTLKHIQSVSVILRGLLCLNLIEKECNGERDRVTELFLSEVVEREIR